MAYQRNYDKDTQHEIEEGFANIIGSITGYCIEMRTNKIVDSVAVGRIMAITEQLTQKCKQLYMKYREKVDKVKDVEAAISGMLIIDAPTLIAKLKDLQEAEIIDIAVKHRLMDRVQEKEPWEVTARSRFWLSDEKQAK